jgi:hypothetical protein
MTRIEEKNNKVDDLEDEINRLKKNLKRKENKRLFSCGNCLVTVILVVILLGIYASYLVSLSGIKEIPFFSQRFYSEPMPTYIIEVEEMSQQEKDVLNIFKDIVAKEAFAQKKTGDFNIFLELSDKQLTAILRDKIKENETISAKVEYSQLAVLDENLELFVKNKSKLVFTILIKPEIKDELVDLKIVGFKLGNLKLPNFIGDISFAYFTEKGINSVLNVFKTYGKVDKIKLNQGEVLLEIFINDIKNLI